MNQEKLKQNLPHCKESSFSQNSNDIVWSLPQRSPSAKTNLRRFVGTAAVGLLEFGSKNTSKNNEKLNYYSDVYDQRFFDSRDYRCCFSIFHAKIGTFIFCTLILHEIVLGTLYLLTQTESVSLTPHIVILFICRFIQLPIMGILYVGLWLHRPYLLLPFLVTQLSIGTFVDISTLMIIIKNLEKTKSLFLFSKDLKWLNILVPLIIYFGIVICLIWVLYKCFIFLRARCAHDAQRLIDKEKEQMLLKSPFSGNYDDVMKQILPDDISGIRSPNEESFYSDQPSQKTSTNQNSNQSSYRQINNASYKRHLKMNSEDQKALQASLSALTLTKRFSELHVNSEDKTLKKVRSATMPPHLLNLKEGVQKSPNCNKSDNRRRLFSEKSNDLETTMFLIQQKNSRNLNKRFKSSFYSLQEAIKLHMAVNKANLSTLTISKVGEITTPPVSITPSVTIEFTPSIKSLVSSKISSQSLTLIETPSNINKANLLTPIADLDQPIFIKSILNTDIENNVTLSLESDENNIKTSFEIIPRNDLQKNYFESNINEHQQQTTSRFSTYLVKDKTKE